LELAIGGQKIKIKKSKRKVLVSRFARLVFASSKRAGWIYKILNFALSFLILRFTFLIIYDWAREKK